MLRQAFVPCLLVCLFTAAPLRAAATAANPVDLSDPCKTYAAFLEARLADNLPAMMACVTMPAAKKKMIDTLLKYHMARHQLETAAIAKFGRDASKTILDTTRPIQEELQAQQKRLEISRPDIERDGTTAVLYLRPERDVPPGVEPFDEGIHFIKVGDQWKIDAVRYLHQEDPDDPELARQQQWGVALYGTIAPFIDTLTADIRKGAFQSAAQVRAALDNKWNALGEGSPATAAPADTAPANAPAAPETK